MPPLVQQTAELKAKWKVNNIVAGSYQDNCCSCCQGLWYEQRQGDRGQCFQVVSLGRDILTHDAIAAHLQTAEGLEGVINAPQEAQAADQHCVGHTVGGDACISQDRG